MNENEKNQQEEVISDIITLANKIKEQRLYLALENDDTLAIKESIIGVRDEKFIPDSVNPTLQIIGHQEKGIQRAFHLSPKQITVCDKFKITNSLYKILNEILRFRNWMEGWWTRNHDVNQKLVFEAFAYELSDNPASNIIEICNKVIQNIDSKTIIEEFKEKAVENSEVLNIYEKIIEYFIVSLIFKYSLDYKYFPTNHYSHYGLSITKYIDNILISDLDIEDKERLQNYKRILGELGNCSSEKQIEYLTNCIDEIVLGYDFKIISCYYDAVITVYRSFFKPIKRTIIWLDVSDFSKLNPEQQTLVANSLVTIVKSSSYYFQDTRLCEKSQCMGDGFFAVFTIAHYACEAAVKLAKSLDLYNSQHSDKMEIHYRLSVHYGDVYYHLDIADEWNFIGDAINDGQRLISVVKDLDDVIFVSHQLRNLVLDMEATTNSYGVHNDQAVFGYQTDCVHIQNKWGELMTAKGRHPDKHGKSHRIYVLEHCKYKDS